MREVELVYEVVKHFTNLKDQGRTFPIMVDYEFTRHFPFKSQELKNALIEALNNKLLLGKYRTATAFSGSSTTFKIEGVTMKGRQFVNDMERPDEPEGVGKIGYV